MFAADGKIGQTSNIGRDSEREEVRVAGVGGAPPSSRQRKLRLRAEVPGRRRHSEEPTGQALGCALSSASLCRWQLPPLPGHRVSEVTVPPCRILTGARAPCCCCGRNRHAPAPGSVRGPFLSVLEFRRPQGSLSLCTMTPPPSLPTATCPSKPAFSVSKRGSRRATSLGARRERPFSRPRRARAEARDGGCRSPKRPLRGRGEAVASTFSRPRAESADLARVLIPGAHGL